jgi:hypothetical protein
MFKYSSFSALQELHFRCPPSNRRAGEAKAQQIKCYTPVVYFYERYSSLLTPLPLPPAIERKKLVFPRQQTADYIHKIEQ